MKLKGYEAIDYAAVHGLTLSKYSDPTEEAREGVTPEEARRIASEDPSLIYIEVEPIIPAADQWVSMRQKAREAVITNVHERAANEHRKNYHKLHVWRDGDVKWTEHLNRTDDFIDSGAQHFAAVPSVATVGTGSIGCNCDFCNEVYSEADESSAREDGRKYDRAAKWASREEAIGEAVAGSDLYEVEAEMLAEFDRIPVGYFNDEENEQ